MEVLLAKLKITISDSINKVTSYGDIIESSLKREVTESDITKCINKLGNTPFICNNLEIIKDDNIFISLSNLNETRREVINKLINIRENIKVKVIINDIKESNYIPTNNKININVLVRNIIMDYKKSKSH